MEIGRLMTERARADGAPLTFIGAGAYEHHIPAAVWAITTARRVYSRPTRPNQAEASQGTLQLIYEFQTHDARLTGMEVANASMYDGCFCHRGGCRSCGARQPQVEVGTHPVPTTLHPHYRRVALTTAANQGLKFEDLPYCTAEGVTAGRIPRPLRRAGHSPRSSSSSRTSSAASRMWMRSPIGHMRAPSW